MFYTRVGSFLAAAIFVLSVFQIVSAIVLLWSGSDQIFLEQRYGRTTGEMIDRGTYGILLGVALGILTEISYKISSIHEAADITLENLSHEE